MSAQAIARALQGLRSSCPSLPPHAAMLLDPLQRLLQRLWRRHRTAASAAVAGASLCCIPSLPGASTRAWLRLRLRCCCPPLLWAPGGTSIVAAAVMLQPTGCGSSEALQQPLLCQQLCTVLLGLCVSCEWRGTHVGNVLCLNGAA